MADGPTFGKRARALTNMDYDEVSLVDVPANQHAMVMISKRHSQGAEMPDLTTDDVELFDHEGYVVDEDDLRTGDVVFDADENPYEYTAPEDMDLEPVGKAATDALRRGARGARNAVRGRAARRGEHDVVAGANGRQIRSAPEGTETAFGRGRRTADGARRAAGSARGAARGAGARARGAALAGGDAAGRAGTASRNGAANVRQTVRNVPGGGLAIGGAAGGAAVYGHDKHVNKSFAEDISKALSEAVDDSDRDAIIEQFAKAYDAQQDELDELAYIAKSERDTRLEGEYIEVAKSLGLPGDPDELGPVLKRMSDVMDPADVEVIAKTLDGISGILYEEFGYDGVVGGGYNGSDIADAEAAAEARISKAGGEPVSKAHGIEQFYVENPGAYDDYLANRR